MIGKITLENGKEAVFSLDEEQVQILEQEAMEVQKLDMCPSYSIADELIHGAIPSWINHLRSMQGRRERT